MEKKVLRGLLVIGLFLLPLTLRGEKNREWIIIFLLKGFFSSNMDALLTKRKKVKYPKRLLPQYFQINILFDYLLFPIACVIFNRLTYHSKFGGIIIISILFSLPMTIIEVIVEKKTKLIDFKNGWSWYHTFLSEILTFIGTRLFIGTVRKYNR